MIKLPVLLALAVLAGCASTAGDVELPASAIPADRADNLDNNDGEWHQPIPGLAALGMCSSGWQDDGSYRAQVCNNALRREAGIVLPSNHPLTESDRQLIQAIRQGAANKGGIADVKAPGTSDKTVGDITLTERKAIVEIRSSQGNAAGSAGDSIAGAVATGMIKQGLAKAWACTITASAGYRC